jgi:hypothetical protein
MSGTVLTGTPGFGGQEVSSRAPASNKVHSWHRIPLEELLWPRLAVRYFYLDAPRLDFAQLDHNTPCRCFLPFFFRISKILVFFQKFLFVLCLPASPLA